MMIHLLQLLTLTWHFQDSKCQASHQARHGADVGNRRQDKNNQKHMLSGATWYHWYLIWKSFAFWAQLQDPRDLDQNGRGAIGAFSRVSVRSTLFDLLDVSWHIPGICCHFVMLCYLIVCFQRNFASFATGPGSGEKHLDLLLHLSWGLPAQGQTFLSLLCQLPLDLGQLRLTWLW